ncbi:MAG: carbohydrate ABC transporter substrate-binding protein [Devosia sp.]|jgi:multiple sugar transport system substrate-binding protein|uniref:ABC transporter substrate-binding protein n=1 Tax=unclassified Devosia TaxID=196773 RepID=UPI0019E59A3A|nr:MULTISPECIES: ABC transporter substrate-binding protein [unclassified Devosia]MBF0678987.1 carbohydrate ABC transporter substrate-binding protein [Devosia sp.]WEJ33602.1 ABC transporter substrate-binding protein [Devosia sp. SD17-2]
MTFRIGRRQFLMGSSALIAAGAAGFSPAFAQGNPLRMIWWGGQARADRTLAVADAYADAKGITPLEGEFLSWNDYWPKLATQTAGGTAPDILQMDYRFIVEYASRNAIAPLDEYVGGVLDLSDFDEDQLEGGKVGGKLYGLSLGANSVAMLANSTAFEEAGLTVPGMDWTYDTLRELGEAFKAANIRGGMKAMSDASGAEPMLDNWIRQRGKALYTPEGKLGPDADDMVEWFTMWNEFRDAGYIVSAEDNALDTGAPETSMVAMSKAALLPSNSNQLVIHQSVSKDNLTITSYPRIAAGVGGGHYRKPSQFWSIAGSSQNKEAAAEFLSYFINDTEAGKVLGVERGIPCSAKVRDAVAPTLSEQDQIALNFVANLGDLLGPLPASPPNAAGEIDTSLLRVLSQEVAFGARSAEDAGKFFVEEATAILNRAAV